MGISSGTCFLFFFVVLFEKMVKKIVSVSVGRSQLLSSFFLLNSTCVWFSKRSDETRVSWEKGLGAGGIAVCGGAILFWVCTGLRDWTIRLVLSLPGAAAWRVVP